MENSIIECYNSRITPFDPCSDNIFEFITALEYSEEFHHNINLDHFSQNSQRGFSNPHFKTLIAPLKPKARNWREFRPVLEETFISKSILQLSEWDKIQLAKKEYYKPTTTDFKTLSLFKQSFEAAEQQFSHDEVSSTREAMNDFSVTTSSVKTNIHGLDIEVHVNLDADCYEAQLEDSKRKKKFLNKDVPVVVLNRRKIVSVNYSAKARGINRNMNLATIRRLQRKKFKNLVIIRVGHKYGMPDDVTAQVASDDVLNVLRTFQQKWKNENCETTITRTSKDEFSLNITSLVKAMYHHSDDPLVLPDLPPEIKRLSLSTKTHPCPAYNGLPTVTFDSWTESVNGVRMPGDPKNRMFILGAAIAKRLIDAIYIKTGLHFSAGVGPNRLLAKLASGRNKPQGICIINEQSFLRTSHLIKVQELSGYKSKKGEDFCAEFFKMYGKEQVNVADIRAMGLAKIVKIFHRMNYNNPIERSLNLLRKCMGQDDKQMISKVHPIKTTVSMTLSDYNEVEDFRDFRKQNIRNLCTKFVNKLRYIYSRHGRKPEQIVVRAILKRWVIQKIKNSTMVNDRLPTKFRLVRFVERYLQTNNIPFEGIRKLVLQGRQIINVR